MNGYSIFCQISTRQDTSVVTHLPESKCVTTLETVNSNITNFLSNDDIFDKDRGESL